MALSLNTAPAIFQLVLIMPFQDLHMKVTRLVLYKAVDCPSPCLLFERQTETERDQIKHSLHFPVMVSVQKSESPHIITSLYSIWLNLFFFSVLY